MATYEIEGAQSVLAVIANALKADGITATQFLAQASVIAGTDGNVATVNSGGAVTVVFPDVLITGGGIGGIAPRLRVDPGSTGFFAKREVTTFREFSQPLGTHIPNGERVLIRFISPVNFILRSIQVVGDNGQVRVPLQVGGTPTGTFSTAWPSNPTNSMTEGPSAYVPQIAVAMAGPGVPAAVTITGGAQLGIIRLKVENATGAATTGSTAIGAEIGLPAATYYALVDNIGAGVFEGVISALWEER